MKVRCAIYTRKSTEKGLEQDFNSLDNQQEACKNYILSQSFNNWEYFKTYEDAAISGGTMDREALHQMLEDIKKGLINVVVVYKVDRLSRSIMDFYTMIRVFEKYNCHFVSITQSFDTSNSMGKLTLNMLLSFAQFEREVSAERVRDKIASSRAKGLWMGGSIPLGYKLENKKLIPNETETQLVRLIYEQYLKLGSINDTVHWLNQNGYRTRRGYTFGHTSVETILKNPIYIGKVRHKDKIYTGIQPPIVDRTIWYQVSHILKESKSCTTYHKSSIPALLNNLIFYQTQPLSFTAVKKGTNINRYYYIKKGKYFNADYLDRKVMEAISDLFNVNKECINESLFNELKYIDFNTMDTLTKEALTKKILKSVVIEDMENLKIILSKEALLNLNEYKNYDLIKNNFVDRDFIYVKENEIIINVKIDLNQRFCTNEIVGSVKLNNVNQELLAAVVQAFKYKKLYEEYNNVKKIAKITNEGVRKIYKYLNLSYLSPTIINKIIEGKITNLRVVDLLTLAEKSADWMKQEKMI